MREYLSYIEEITKKGSIGPCFAEKTGKENTPYAKATIITGSLRYRVCNKRLEKIYPTSGYTDDKTVCSLKWINTRNRLSEHIIKSLLGYQSKFWFSTKNVDLKPLTLKQFISLYPAQYLDQSRLSRLVSNLSIINPQGKLICVRDLFISERRCHAYLIKEIIDSEENALTDCAIQSLLAQKGIHLMLKTICNCRGLIRYIIFILTHKLDYTNLRYRLSLPSSSRTVVTDLIPACLPQPVFCKYG